MLLQLVGGVTLGLSQAGAATPNHAVSFPSFANDVCFDVAHATSEIPSVSPMRYAYQTAFYRAAGVNPRTDRPDVIRQKMQRFWNQHQQDLHCNRYVPTADSHILKLVAFNPTAMEFLREAVTSWRVDLNHVDRSGRTALDFIEEEIARAASGRTAVSFLGGPDLGRDYAAHRLEVLQESKRLLEAHGARRVRDLPPASRSPRGPAHEMLAFRSEQVNLAWFASNLCVRVANPGWVADDRGIERWTHQIWLFEAAGVDAQQDSREVVREKMQHWWSRYQHGFRCNLLNSSGPKHILKLAVETGSQEFINDVARRWQVDLNFVSDGGTVMDYIDAELVRARGTPREAIFNEYREIFQRRGALRAQELR